MSISATLIKDLRGRTGAGMMDCKNVLVETSGDMEQAIDLLRKKGVAKAAKKSARETKEGTIASYVHANGKIGVLVELLCETDFVGKNETFRSLGKDICMHVAAANPSYLTQEEVPQEVLDKEKSFHEDSVKGKPEHIVEKILDGKMAKYFSESCLMNQTFVKDGDFTIQELLTKKINELGENIILKRFERFELGS